uniref:hypothetical protein n=1 Tax=Escherichia coli TaxID=562 RepID=UPI001116E668
MVFIIDDKTISDIIRNHEHTNHAGYYFYLSEHYQMERAGWMTRSGGDFQPRPLKRLFTANQCWTS